MQLRRIVMGLATVASLGATVARAGEAGRLPADWFVLPEDRQAYEASNPRDEETVDGNTYSRGVDKAGESIDKILTYTAEAMEENGDTLGRREPPPNAPPDWVPWHLREMFMNVGVSLNGTAGLITGIGAASLEINWRQRQEALKNLGVAKPEQAPNEQAPVEEAPGEPADLTINEYTTKEEMERMVDRVTDAAMATGKITAQRGKVREGLQKAADDLQSLMVNINQYNDSTWDINRFGLEVNISVSGKVGTGFTVGGAVRLRFEWLRTAQYSTPRPEPMDGNYASREDLRKLLAGIASDMDTISREHYADSGFDLTFLRVGVGLYFGAKWGVVSGKLGITGYVYFNKVRQRANKDFRDAPHIVTDEFPALADAPPPAHLSYAASKNVRYDHVPGGDAVEDRVVYYISRPRFQRGLQKAAQMGAFFAKRAAEKTGESAEHKRWYVNYLRPNFSLSLEGALQVVTIGGTVFLEMNFVRRVP